MKLAVAIVIGWLGLASSEARSEPAPPVIHELGFAIDVTALDAAGRESAPVVRDVRGSGSRDRRCGAAGAMWLIGVPLLVVFGGSLLIAFVSVLRYLRAERATWPPRARLLRR